MHKPPQKLHWSGPYCMHVHFTCLGPSFGHIPSAYRHTQALTSFSPLPCSLASCCARATAFMRHDTPADADVGPEGPPDAAAASAAFLRASSRSAAGGGGATWCVNTQQGWSRGADRGTGCTRQGACGWLGGVAAQQLVHGAAKGCCLHTAVSHTICVKLVPGTVRSHSVWPGKLTHMQRSGRMPQAFHGSWATRVEPVPHQLLLPAQASCSGCQRQWQAPPAAAPGQQAHHTLQLGTEQEINQASDRGLGAARCCSSAPK
jgi:hypothetical protein